MSKKTLFSLIASILGVSGMAEASISKLEVSIGGNPTEFPEGSKGFLVVDTAGDGFDFAKSPTILEKKSESAVGSKWGDDDTVVMAGLPTAEFPGVGRGFNATPRDVESSSWKSGDKLAMVWFPEGSSAGGKRYSYYTSNQIESERGTNAFEIPEDGAVDSIVAVGTPSGKGTVASSPSVTPPSSGVVPPEKVKKGKGSKNSSASKSASAKLKSDDGRGSEKSSASKSGKAKLKWESRGGSKKPSASKSSRGKKSTAKKSKKN